MIEPIRRSIVVRCDPATAFRVFTAEMDTWWPLHTHSRAQQDREGESIKAERIVVEERVGGRIYEVMSDGTEANWGSILTWNPPVTVVIAWQPNDDRPAATELELRFLPEGGATRVELEHRGWERLGTDALDAREGYANGWPATFDRYYGDAANAAADQ
jgi:uncharacterized protein YndB with AHSA1/START domain